MLAILAALNFGISAGVGLSHDVVGLRLDARYQQFTLFASTGVLNFQPGIAQDTTGWRSVGFGARWSSSPRGDRFFLAGNYLIFVHKERTEGWVHDNMATVTAGWRFKARSDVMFADVGAGGGLLFKSDDGYKAHPRPDITLAVGMEF